jgi:hypothetical protein
MTMSSKYSKNFLVGDIVAIECKVSSNYLHSGGGEISLVPIRGSTTAIYVKEDNITLIRPILEKGDAVMCEGYVFNVVAQDMETEQTWISRNDGASNHVVQSSELTRLVYAEVEPLVPGERLQDTPADLMAKAATQAGLSAEDLERFTVDVEEAPPPAPEAGEAAVGPHTFEGPGDLCEACGLTFKGGRHETEAF